MNKELIDRAWACLPREFKEKVKKEYYHDDSNPFELAQLEAIFGIHNLTPDAVEEEMLTVPRKKVEEKWQRAYEQEAQYSRAQDSPVARLELYYNRGILSILDTLFGSKCLPNELNEDNFATKKPQPAEPKEKSSNSTELKSQEVDKHLDAIIKDGFRENNRLHIAAMAMAGILSYGDLADPDEVTDMAIIYADELIEKCKKGGSNA